MKPTKILDTPTWWEMLWDGIHYISRDFSRNMPLTDISAEWMYNAREKAKKSKTSDERALNVSNWQTAMATLPITFAADVLWNIWTTAVNWYKKLYNVWADLSNRAKSKIIDEQIKEFQREHPNRVSQPTWKGFEYESPAEKVKKTWAATDAEVWEATHQFWYWNDPRTVYRRLRYRKQQVSPKPRISL